MTCLSLFAVTVALSAAAADPLVVEIDAGKFARRNAPIVLALPPESRSVPSLVLEDPESGVVLPVHPSGINRESGIALVTLPAGARKKYLLKVMEHGPPIGSIRIRYWNDGKATSALVNDRVVWTYRSETAEPPAGIESVYRRSGFLHPLTTPSGRVVTDDFAADHPHQHGLFLAWTNTTFRGKAMNFWDQLQKTARVRDDTGVTGMADAYRPAFVLRHEDITAGEDRPHPVLNEVWTLATHPLSSPFLVDLTSTQEAATTDALVINKYHYGGFGFRGNLQWFDPKVTGENPPDPSRSGESDFLTSDGKTRADGNHTRPRWIDLHGKIDGQFAGIAVLQHPSNFRFPQPVRLHPNKPYFSIAPAVLGEFKIEKGTPHVSRYRLVLHDGEPDPKELDRLWNDYADPPIARLVEEAR